MSHWQDENGTAAKPCERESCSHHHESSHPYCFLKDKPLKVNGQAIP
jgi:hypothetical protein